MHKDLLLEKKRNSIISFQIILFLFFYSVGFSQQISKKTQQIKGSKISIDQQLTLFNNVLEEFQTSKNYTQLGYDAHQIAKWLHKTKDHKETAIEIVKIAIEARQKAEPFRLDLLKESYNNLGLYFFRNQEFKKSIQIFRKITQLTESEYLVGRAYLKIGDCYSMLKEPYLAIDNYYKAFPFLEANNQKKFIPSNHIKIFTALKATRIPRYNSKAIKHLLKAESLILNSEQSNKINLVVLYNNLGAFYVESKNDTLNSEKYFKKSLKLSHELNLLENIATIEYNLGIAKINRNNSIARKHFNNSLLYSKGNNDLQSRVFCGLGMINRIEKKYQSATDLFYKSLSFLLNKDILEKDFNLDFIQKENIHLNQISFLLEILHEITENYIEQAAYSGKKKFYHKAIQIVKIMDFLNDKALSRSLSNDAKLMNRNMSSRIFSSGIKATEKLGNFEYGFYLCEKNKAILLRQEIAKDNIKLNDSLINESIRLKMKIVNLEHGSWENTSQFQDSVFNNLYEYKLKLLTLKENIAINHPNYNKTKTIPKILPLSEIELKNNEVILQYMMVERIGGILPDTYCLFLSDTTKKIFKLPKTKTLHDKIFNIRQLLNKPFINKKDQQSYRKVANDLYKAVIPEEIRPLLAHKKITIVPDHLLSLLPFEALISNENTGRYFIEDAEINYTYSLSFQKQNATRQRNATKEFLGIAPVDFNNTLIPLKSTKKEIQKIKSFYSGETLIDSEGTKENFINKVADHKIIHLATHANAADTISPWIAFRNHKMLSGEIELLRNNAELVVLSACNTSLGQVNSGEGISSLARSFFQSGANTVIPSLWSSNDKATATITGDFYKHLSKGKTKSEALRQAKLNYLKNNSDAEASPHYWASLILIGDTGVLLPETNYLWWYIAGGILLLLLSTLLILKKI